MNEERERIAWVDIAKTIGILLVIYGHIVQSMQRAAAPGIFFQYKFIYSFHMPLFFMLSGFFFKKRNLSVPQKIKSVILKRLVPVLFFELILIPIWPIYLYLKFGYIDFTLLGDKFISFVCGNPAFNGITWFLVCLFVVELIAIFVIDKVEKVSIGLLIAALFFNFSLVLTGNMKAAEQSFGISKNFWYLHEALVAFGFYAFGYSIFRYIKKLSKLNILWRLFLLVVFCALTILTYNLNQPVSDVVLMKVSRHGDSTLFLISAFSGSFFVIMPSSLIPRSKFLDLLGRNTLVLLGTSGFFHSFVNSYLIGKFPHLDSLFLATGFGILITAFNVLLSVPAIKVLNRYLPQLVAKPYHPGSLLPDLTLIKLDRLNRILQKAISALGSIHED
jgi:fucose 4-O-acetylase-like acetyltransferase